MLLSDVELGQGTIGTTTEPKLTVEEVAAAKGEDKMGTTADALKNEEIHELIAVCAYDFWENQGRPHGCDLIHWLQSEQEIMSCVDDGKGAVALEGTKAKAPD